MVNTSSYSEFFSTLFGFVISILWVLIFAFLVQQVVRRIREPKLFSKWPEINKAWLFIASFSALTILLYQMAHEIMDLKFPKDRTGLYLVLLACALVIISIAGFHNTAWQKQAAQVGQALLLITVFLNLFSFRIDYFKQWKYAAGTQEIFLIISEHEDKWDHINYGLDWLLEPSLNFYRIVYEVEGMPEFVRDSPSPNNNILILTQVFLEDNPDFLNGCNCEIIFQHPVSETILAIGK